MKGSVLAAEIIEEIIKNKDKLVYEKLIKMSGRNEKKINGDKKSK